MNTPSIQRHISTVLIAMTIGCGKPTIDSATSTSTSTSTVTCAGQPLAGAYDTSADTCLMFGTVDDGCQALLGSFECPDWSTATKTIDGIAYLCTVEGQQDLRIFKSRHPPYVLSEDDPTLSSETLYFDATDTLIAISHWVRYDERCCEGERFERVWYGEIAPVVCSYSERL